MKTSVLRKPHSNLSLVKAVGTRSYSVFYTLKVEDVILATGSAGSIALRIHNPPTHGSVPDGPVILSLSNSLSKPIPRALLSKKTTLVTVVPRWSQLYPFPTPLHDTIRAYDWIRANLCSPTSSPPSPPRSTSRSPYNDHSEAVPFTRPIAIHSTGRLSSIALSLGLTESKSSSRHRVSAVAVRDGIYDYSMVALNQLPEQAEAPLKDLWEKSRTSLFKNASAPFDPFVSPVMWFRSPGVHVPTQWPGEGKEDQPVGRLVSDDEEHIREESGGGQDREVQKKVDEVDLMGQPSRQAFLTFQTKGSGIKLPYTRIAVSGHGIIQDGKKKGKKALNNSVLEENSAYDDLLAEQALDMSELLRRSVSLHEMREREGGHEEALRRIDLVRLGESQENDEGEWAAEWFDNVI